MPSLTLDITSSMITAKLGALLKAQAASERSRSELNWPYRGMAEFVLTEGKPFHPAELCGSERRFARSLAAAHWRVHGPLKHGESFLNSQRCLLFDDSRRFAYAEGFVLDERAGHLELHGWLVLDERVVDFTAAAPQEPQRASEPPQVFGASARRAYFGVRFRRGYVEQRARETGRLGSVIDDWEHGFPLLRCSDAAWRAESGGATSA